MGPNCIDGVKARCCAADGHCDDGDDDWCCNDVFYCSNNGAAYAELKGGINCPHQENAESDPFNEVTDEDGRNNCADVFSDLMDDARNDCAPVIAANNDYSAQYQALQTIQAEFDAIGEGVGPTCYKDVQYILQACGLASSADPAIHGTICDQSTLCGKAMYRVENYVDCTTVDGIDYNRTATQLSAFCTPHYQYACGCPAGTRESVPYTGPFGPAHTCEPIPASDLYQCVCPPGYTEKVAFDRHPWMITSGDAIIDVAPAQHECVPPATLAPTGAPTATPTKHVRTGECYSYEFKLLIDGCMLPHANDCYGCAMLTTCTATEFEFVAPTVESDRICTPQLVCDPDQYQSAAPTFNTNRGCAKTTLCQLGTTFETKEYTATQNRECTPVSQCNFATQYRTAAATLETDTKCADLAVCDLTTQFVAAAPTDTTDRVCEPLSVCDTLGDTATQFEQGRKLSGDRNCQELRVCSPNQEYQTIAPTDVSDRGCASYTECVLGVSYETQSTTDYSNRKCSPTKVCSGTSEFESTAATLLVDRTCSALTVCTAGEFEETAPTPTTNRVCTALTVCTDDVQYQLGYKLNGDRNCVALTTCVSEQEFEFYSPTTTSNRICTALTECEVGKTYETHPYSTLTDRVCGPVTPCNFLTHFESDAPTALANRVCKPLSDCDAATHFEFAKPTSNSDRDCRPFTVCTNTQFQAGFRTNGDRNCIDVQNCLFTQFVAAASSASSDRVCSALTTCVAGKTYETTAPTGAGTFKNPYTSNRVCSRYTKCKFKTHFESVAPSSSADRQCSPISVCSEQTQYETSAPTKSTDRKCTTLTVCTPGSQFQAGFKANGDRNCINFKTCAAVGTEYTEPTEEGTAFTDRRCRAVRQCVVGVTYETSDGAPTANKDRVCVPVDVCNYYTHFLERAATLTANAVCTTLISCTQDQYETTVPNPGVVGGDRGCTDFTPCDTHTQLLTGFQSNGNLECAAQTNCDDDNNINDIPKEYESSAILEDNTLFSFAQIIMDRMCALSITCDPTDQTVSGSGAGARCTAKAYTTDARRLTDGMHGRALGGAVTSVRAAANFWLQSATCSGGTQYWTTCKTDGTQYMTSGDPCQQGAEYTPVCAQVSTCDTDQQYESAAPSLTTNRVCTTLDTCTIGSQYESKAPATANGASATSTNPFISNRNCLTIKTCGSNEFETSAPTASADRGCQTGLECSASQYETKALSSKADRTCGSLSVCNKFQYVSTVHTSSSDRVCSSAGFCGANQYISNLDAIVAGGTDGTANYDCQTLEQCESIEFEATAPKNLYIAAFGDASLSSEEKASYQSLSGSEIMYVTDRHCEDLTTCSETQFQSTEPTLSTNRACTTGQPCTDLQYASTTMTQTSDRQCSTRTVCSIFQYQSTAPTASTDRQCTNAGFCSATKFITLGALETAVTSAAQLGTQNYNCKALTPCESSQYEKIAPIDWNSTSDLTIAQKHQYLALSSFSKMLVSDRTCAPLTECNTTSFASKEATTTTDRVCSAATVCTPSQYESRSMTTSSNRQCSALTQCKYFEYQSVAPTTTTDRVCSAVTQCDSDFFISNFDTFLANNTINFKCEPLKQCTSSEYQSADPINHYGGLSTVLQAEYRTKSGSNSTVMNKGDRTCSALATCNNTIQFESTAKTTTSDRKCSTATECDAVGTQYETVALSLSADRKCANVTKCSIFQYQSSPPTTTSNTACTTAGFCGSTTFISNVDKMGVDDYACENLKVCDGHVYTHHYMLRDGQDWMLAADNNLTQAQKYVYGNASGNTKLYTSDRTCKALSVCSTVDQYISTKRTTTSNRLCAEAKVCAAVGTEYQTSPLKTFENRACAAVTQCTDLQYESTAPLAFNNRVCTDNTPCPATAFVNNFEAAKGKLPFNCSKLTTCGEGYSEGKAPNNWFSNGATVAQQNALNSANANGILYIADRDCLKDGQTYNPTMAPTLAPTEVAKCDYSKQYRNYSYRPESEVFVCKDHSACNAATQYETLAATETNDRTCATLTICSSAQYQTKPPGPDNDRTCDALTTCSDAQYVTRAATAIADRTCGTLTVCAAVGTEFEAAPPSDCPTGSNKCTDRVCSVVTQCPATHTQLQAPSATADRQCEPINACTYTTQYLKTAGTSTAQSVCETLTACTSTQYESVPPTTAVGGNRGCANYVYCTATEYFAGFDPNGQMICENLNACSSSTAEYVDVAGSTDIVAGESMKVMDNICATEITCDSSKFDSSGAGSSKVCTAQAYSGRRLGGANRRLATQYWNKCPSDQYMVSGNPYTAGTVNAPVCKMITACHINWQYQFTAPAKGSGDLSDVWTQNRACTQLTICNAVTHFQSTAPSTIQDRVCTPFKAACNSPTEYESSKPTTSSDRMCATSTDCDLATHYISMGVTLSSDRGCTALTECKDASPMEYEHTKKTQTSDRICAAANVCSKDKGLYISNSAEFLSSTRDQIVCLPQPTCNYNTQYIQTYGLEGTGVLSSFYLSQLTCATLATACDFASTYESVSPDTTTDRTCTNLRNCVTTPEASVGGGPKEWESKAPSQVTNRECKSTTASPTQSPTGAPTQAPTKYPTNPTGKPTRNPTQYPSPAPTPFPTKTPTKFPTTSNKNVQVLDDYFKGCTIFQDCGSPTRGALDRNAYQDALEPSCKIEFNDGKCTTYGGIIIDQCQTVMDVTRQNGAECRDIGTDVVPTISHTSNPEHETTTIMTTLLDVAAAFATSADTSLPFGGNFALTRAQLESALGADLGTIGQGDPVAVVRNNAPIGSLSVAEAQKQLSWNAQFMAVLNTVKSLIEIQATKMGPNHGYIFKRAPTSEAAHTPVTQVHSIAALGAFKALIKSIKAIPTSGSLRRLATSSFLSDPATLTAMVAAGFSDAQSAIQKDASISGSIEGVAAPMVAAIINKVATVNEKTAKAAKDGNLNIGTLNTYNYMQNEISVRAGILVENKQSYNIAEFESETSIAELEQKASEAVLHIEKVRNDAGVTHYPTTSPTKFPTAGPPEIRGYFERYASLMIIGIVLVLLVMVGVGYLKYHHANEHHYQQKWMHKRGFKAANPDATPVESDDLDDVLAHIGAEAEPQAFGEANDTMDLHSVDV
jgi:hypothetical protein